MANFGGNNSRWLSSGSDGRADNNGMNGNRSSRPQQQPSSPSKPIWRSNSSASNGAPSTSNEQLPKKSVDLFCPREGGGGMRVGKDFQAKIPAFIDNKASAAKVQEGALLVWKPCPRTKLTDNELEKYVLEARNKFRYNEEQAMGLLYWHGFDMHKSLRDLGNFTPQPEQWTVEDRVIFEQAFQFHGKDFKKLRLMLPDKSMSSLICYYYNWKKTRAKQSAIDRKRMMMSVSSAKSTVEQKTGGPGVSTLPGPSSGIRPSVGGSSSNSTSQAPDSDDDILNKQNGKNCGNCGIPCTSTFSKDNLCQTCHLYWKRTGDHRPLVGSLKRPGDKPLGLCRQKKEPPQGMFVNHDDLKLLASSPPQAKNVITQGLEQEILGSKYRVQQLKQEVDILQRKLPQSTQIAKLKPPKPENSSTSSPPKVTARWTQEELHLTALAFRRYGRNYSKISKIIPTKNEAHLKSFYANYKTRYNLDNLIKEQESESKGLSDNYDIPTYPAKRRLSNS